MKKQFVRILSLVLALALVLPLPAAAAEDAPRYPRDREGKIQIYTTATEQYQWDALLHEENGSEYVIYMKPADVAAIAGVDISWQGSDTVVFIRNVYEVWVDLSAGTAWVEILSLSGEIFRPYGTFELEEPIEFENESGNTTLYVPLEQLLYLLNASWYIKDQIVFVFPTGENMWDILGTWPEQFDNLPTYGHVVGESIGEILGNSFMYSILSVADELDARILFSGNLFQNSKMESALLEMSQSAITRMNSSEAQKLDNYLLRMDPGYEEALKRVENVFNVADSVSDGTVGQGFAQQICKSLIEAEVTDFGLEMGTLVGVLGTTGKVWKVLETAGRAKNWSEGYVAQLEYLSELTEKGWLDAASSDVERQIRSAAESLYTEQGSTLLNAAWEGGKEAANAAVEHLLGAVGGTAFLAKQCFDAAISIVRTFVPVVDEALLAGDYAMNMKAQYNIASVVGRKYSDALNTLVRDGVSQRNLEDARLVGTLMTNAAAHCYFNLYVLEQNSFYLSRAQVNTAYAIRLANTQVYDMRLYLQEDFGNLYSRVVGAIREQIPEDYVLFPPEQVIVTTQYIQGEGDNYTYSYPLVYVYIPGRVDLQEKVNFGEAMVDLVRGWQDTVAMLEDMDSDSEMYSECYLESAYATTGFLSLKFRSFAYTGGAHPIHGTNTFLIDLTTGQTLTLGAMLDEENDQAGRQLVNLVADAMESEYGDAVSAPDSAAERILTGTAGWTMDAMGMKVEFAPGDIAPYSAGYITVYIPYTDLEGILKEEYLPKPIRAEGTPQLCRASDRIVDQVDYHFGDESAQAVAATERVDYITVTDGSRVLMYANYLEYALVWLPRADSYTVSCNGLDGVNMEP